MRSFRRDQMCTAAVSALVLACPMVATPALANPQGGVVVGGQATVTSSGNTVQVNQSSKVVVIDWNSFNIAQGETTVFNQPGATAMAVNRIGGANPSQILGNLLANGRIVIINGNGVLFGPNARINVGSLVATTEDASNADLMSGKATFSGTSTATVENQGSITTTSGGVVGLIAGAVSNSGLITARLGSVTLGASRQFTLDFTGDGLISFPIDGQVLARAIGSDGQPVQALVANSGRIEGSTVLLSGRAAQGLVQNVVDMSGVVVATNARDAGGAIVLDGGDGGVAISGALDASGSQGPGGTVSVSGGAIALTGAAINATGTSGGGTVTLGGWSASSLVADGATSIDVSATQQGDGGHVSVIAQENGFFGSISARGGALAGDGGSVETSGDLLSVTGARVDTLAPHGKTGNWLLDPYTVEICDDSTPGGCTTSGYAFPDTTTDGSVSTINVSDLVQALATSNVTIAAHGEVVPGMGSTTVGSGNSGTTTTGSGNPTTGGNPSTSGGGTTGSNPTDPPSDITVLTPISWSAPTVLELGASDAIDIQKPITVGGGGGLVLGDATDTSLQPQSITIGANINFTGSAAGAPSVLTLNPAPDGSWSLYDHAVVSFADTGYAFSAGGVSYTLIGDAATLASDLASNPGGDYALARDLDASGSAYTAPLAADFTGVFEGFNHAIDSLTINDTSDSNVGLFGIVDTGAVVQDLALTHLSVTGSAASASVGGLAGANNGTLSDIEVSGAVTGGASANVGGLVGDNGAAISGATVNAVATAGDNGVVGGVMGTNSGYVIYASAAGAAIGGRSATVGGLAGDNSYVVTQSLSTAFVQGGAGSTVGGFVGANSNIIAASYFDVDAAGTTTAAGSDTGTTAITGDHTAALQSALPADFDSTVWAIGSGDGYPYLINAYSGVPQVISGVAYSDAGTTKLGSSSSGLVSVDVLLSGADVGDVTAGANGYYYLALQPGTLSGSQDLLTYLAGGSVKANTYIQAPSADVTNADLYGGTLRMVSAAGSVSDILAGVSTAVGSKTGRDLLYSGGAFATNASLRIESSSSSGLVIDSALTSGAGDIVIDASGPVTQSAALTGAGLVLLGTNASYTLTASNAVSTVAANTGAVDLANGADLTVGAVGGVTGVTSSAAVTLSGSDLTIASGAQVTAGSGANVVLSTAGNFINSEGGDAVQVSGGGRWLIYSNAPGGDTFGALDSSNTAIWNSTLSGYAPASVTQSGDRYLFAYQPTVTVTTTDVTKEYGADASTDVAAAYTIGAVQSGVANAYLGDSAAAVYSGTPTVTSTGSAVTAGVSGSPYAITAAAGSMSVGDGYALAFANTGTLTVTARPITVTADDASRAYGSANPTLTYTVGGDGLVNGDTLSGSLATTATVTSAVGSYSITQGTLGSSNYDITSFTPGTLTVTPATHSWTPGYTASLDLLGGASGLPPPPPNGGNPGGAGPDPGPDTKNPVCVVADAPSSCSGTGD